MRLRSILAVPLAVTLVSVAAAMSTGTSVPAVAHTHSHPMPPHSHSVEDAQRWASIPKTPPITSVNPGAWCGSYRTSDNTANEVANGSPKFHVVIAVPRDVAVQPAYQLSGWQNLADDAFRTVKTVEAFLLHRAGVGRIGGIPHGWQWRFDYGTNCGAQFPDISFFEMPRTQAQYLAHATPFFPITDDLRNSGLYSASNKRYLVHYVGNHDACGESYIYNPTDSSGGAKYSLVYNFLPLGVAETGGTVPSPLCRWETDAHELGHSIGAATGGPLNNDGGHVWDCWNDVMSYADVTAICGDGHMYFDYNHDNYFMHGGTWYDARHSAYWCRSVIC